MRLREVRLVNHPTLPNTVRGDLEATSLGVLYEGDVLIPWGFVAFALLYKEEPVDGPREEAKKSTRRTRKA